MDQIVSNVHRVIIIKYISWWINTNKYNADIVKTKAWFLKNDNITKAKLQIQMGTYNVCRITS